MSACDFEDVDELAPSALASTLPPPPDTSGPVCPCEAQDSDDDPGDHLPSCPWRDPAYDDGDGHPFCTNGENVDEPIPFRPVPLDELARRAGADGAIVVGGALGPVVLTRRASNDDASIAARCCRCGAAWTHDEIAAALVGDGVLPEHHACPLDRLYACEAYGCAFASPDVSAFREHVDEHARAELVTPRTIVAEAVRLAQPDGAELLGDVLARGPVLRA